MVEEAALAGQSFVAAGFLRGFLTNSLIGCPFFLSLLRSIPIPCA